MDRNNVSQTLRSRFRSQRVPFLAATLLAAASLCAMSVNANTTWYFNGGQDSRDSGITTPGKWKSGGTVATAFSADDTYVVRDASRLRIYNTTSFAGGPMQFGDLSNSTRGGFLLEGSSKTMNFQGGLILDRGYCWVYIGLSNSLEAQRDGAIAGGTITVRSPVENPFVIYCNNAAGYNNRRLFITAPMASDAGKGIVVGPAKVGSATYNCGTNFTVGITGDCSAYLGTISVTTAQNVAVGKWDVRLGLGDTTVGGKVRMAPGTALSAWRSTIGSSANTPTKCTIGSLELAANSVILVEGNSSTPTNGIIHVRDELTVVKPVTVKLQYAAATPSLDSKRLTILTAPSASRLDAGDFTFDLGTTSSAQYYDLVVEEDVATQTKSLVAVFGPTVWQKGHYSDEGQKDTSYAVSSFTNAAYWSDSMLPHGGTHYYTGNHYLRTIVNTALDYEFPGLSFTQAGGVFTILTKSFQAPEYVARRYSETQGINITIQLGQNLTADSVKTIKAERFVAKSGNVCLSAFNNQTLIIDGEISGAADFTLRGVSGTSVPRGYYRFTGLNTNFTGNITISQLETRPAYFDFTKGFQTLYVKDGRNLGGAKDNFDAAALKLSMMGRLSATNDVTLSAGLNRGIYIEGVGRLFASEGCTLAVEWPITMHGKLWKEGNGTLVLGGDARFDSANGNPEATSNLFEVAAGTLRVASYNAMDGLETTFDNGTSLVLALDPNDADLVKYGILNAKTGTPFVLGSGLSKLPLTVDVSAYPVVDGNKFECGLVTVANNAETLQAVRGMMPNVKPWSDIHQSVVERENAGEGTVTFVLCAERNAFTIIFR